MADFAALRQRMVDNQIRPSEVTDLKVIDAFLAVPRELFAERSEEPFAYADRELRMAASVPARRMMMPVTLARLIHALPRGPEAKVLVVGCGSGYSAAILASLVGSVVALEEDRELAAIARDKLAAVGAGSVKVKEGKFADGYAADAPYDGILVEGSVELLPDRLIGQIRSGGLLAVVERDDRLSRAMLYEKVGEEAAKWPLFDAWATPLPGFERRREFVF